MTWGRIFLCFGKPSTEPSGGYLFWEIMELWHRSIGAWNTTRLSGLRRTEWVIWHGLNSGIGLVDDDVLIARLLDYFWSRTFC